MLRLAIAGADTTILSTLCATCPYARGGCCVAPPRIALADLGRIVAHGGRDWLLGELAAGRLVGREAWLSIQRPEAGPHGAACVYLGREGCTIPHDRRSATCNHYVCEEALAEDGERGPKARELLARTVDAYAGWDEELGRRAAEAFPGGITWDGAFFDWLGAAYATVSARTRPRPRPR